MTERVWHKGPPPHIGWWNASQGERSDSWRWWDGATWSYGLIDTDRTVVAEYACQKAPNPYMIKWTDYWPENARVPRVDPSLRENRAIVEFINISITSPDPKLWEEAAWKDCHFKHAPAAAGSTRTVREMKERMKPGITSDVPARMSSNGQAYLEAHEKLHKSLIPERRELASYNSLELMKELFRRFNDTP